VTRVVVCGGGVIGACTAHQLGKRGVDVVVVERTGVASGASGRSGAFLALDWARGNPLDPLARRSFRLHSRLLDEIDGDWGYHGVTTYAGYIEPDVGGYSRPPALPWLAGGVVVTGALGSPSTTAVMDPTAFTTSVMRAAQVLGAELRGGVVTGVTRSGSTVTGVEVDGEVVDADAMVVAMGPWSVLAARWLPVPAMYPDKGHSLIFDTGGEVPDALFVEYREPTGNVLSPELFPRADGTTYVTAGSGPSPLPLDPSRVGPDAGVHERLQAACERISPLLTADRVVSRPACIRPATPDGLPVIGALPGVEGAYVAGGHGVWGMLNAPATGEAIAELVVDGVARSTEMAPFDPARFPPMDPSLLRTRPASAPQVGRTDRFRS
jgi:glycine/D-amino acid oxidase-like deaminating enzyme